MTKIFLCLLFLSFSTFSQEEIPNSGPYYKNEISASLGTYALTSPDVSLSGIGSFNLGYHFFLTKKWAPYANFTNIYQNDGGFASIVTGFDFGLSYCLFNCVHHYSKTGDMVLLSEHSKWGFRLGVGFSQRNFQLQTTTVSYSGFALQPILNYFINDRTKALFIFKYASVKNPGNTISELTTLFGLAYDFESISF
jgi:hypothetical protein